MWVWYTCFCVRAVVPAVSAEHLAFSAIRVREHIFSERILRNCKHLQDSEHRRTFCSNDCFSIQDHASATLQLKIKEAIHIQWEKPTVNPQLYHINCFRRSRT